MKKSMYLLLIVTLGSTIASCALCAEEGKQERPVFPLLKAHNWNAKELCVFQNFNGVDKPPIPLVAFCHNQVGEYSLITKQAATKNGWTAKSLRREAQKNIDAYSCEWEEFQGFMLTASGKDFSSEKLLCRDFLLAAEKKLGSKQILVAAPRRTVLYATSSELPEEKLELFKTIVSKTLADDSFGHRVISPLVFRFEKGKLVGALIVKEIEE